MTRATTGTLLAVVLLLAALPRFWGSTSGAPYLFVNDEVYEINRALQLLNGTYDFSRLKGMYFYLLALVYGLEAAFLLALGKISTLDQYLLQAYATLGRAAVLSRWLTSVLSLIGIVLVYFLARRTLPRERELLAFLPAVAFAFSGLLVWNAKWGFIETCLVTLGTASLLAVHSAARTARVGPKIGLGLLLACATATKVYGCLLWLAVLAVHWRAFLLRTPEGHRGLDDRRSLLVIALSYACFLVILSPTLPLLALAFFESHTERVTQSPEASIHLTYYLKNTVWALGYPYSLLSVIGLVVSIRRRHLFPFSLGFFAFSFLAALALTPSVQLVYERYVMLALPALFVLGSYGALHLFDGLRRPSRRLVYGTLCLFVATTWTVLSGLSSLSKTGFFERGELPVQEEARRWFTRNVPPGSRVMVTGPETGWPVFPGHQSVPLYALAWQYEAAIDAFRISGEAVSGRHALPYLARVPDVPRYDLRVLSRRDEWPSLAELQEDRVRYLAVEERIFDPATHHPNDVGRASRLDLGRELRTSDLVDLVQRIEGRTLQGGRRTIVIYRIADPRTAEALPAGTDSLRVSPALA